MVGGIYYFCLNRLSCCRVSCDKARTAEQELLASENCGGRRDWLGHRVAPTIPIIFCCHSDSLSGGTLAIATYIPTPQAAHTCTQKSCTIPNPGMQDACGVEPEVTASSALHRQTNADMAARSNCTISENGCQMSRLRTSSEMVRGRMAVKACPVCTLEHLTALWN